MNLNQNISRYVVGLIVAVAFISIGSQYENIKTELGYLGDKANALVASVSRSAERPPMIVVGGGGTGAFVNKSSGSASGSNSGSNQIVNSQKVISYLLLGTVEGNGSGRITSIPAHGLNCGSGVNQKVCIASYSINTYVLLTAETDKGSIFKGWSGSCKNTKDLSPSCLIKMDSLKSVVAKFTKKPILEVRKYYEDPAETWRRSDGFHGKGTITSSPSGINCGLECLKATSTFDLGTSVTLTANAKADSDSYFVRWFSDNGGRDVDPIISTSTSITFKMSTSSMVVTGLFQLKAKRCRDRGMDPLMIMDYQDQIEYVKADNTLSQAKKDELIKELIKSMEKILMCEQIMFY